MYRGRSRPQVHSVPEAGPHHSPAKRPPAWLGLRITFGGLLYVFIVMLIGLAALNSEANLLLLVAGLALGVLIFSAAAPVAMVRRIEVERQLPEAVEAGRPFRMVYAVRNARPWNAAWSLILGEGGAEPVGQWFPRAFVASLAAGQQQRIELIGNCPVRGRWVLSSVSVTSRFPFGLFTCSTEVANPGELLVFPAVGRLRGDPWRTGRSVSGVSSVRPVVDRVGDDDFYGVREYRQGDNLRWIHWRQSAHLGELVIRETARMRSPQLIVVLDPWAGAGESGSKAASGQQAGFEVEQVISAAATFICDGLERGYRVGLICRAAEPVVLAPAGGRPARLRLLRALALLRPGVSTPFDDLIPHIRWSTGWQAKCLICAPRVDDSHRRVARFLGRRAESVMMIGAGESAFDGLVELPSGAGRMSA